MVSTWGLFRINHGLPYQPLTAESQLICPPKTDNSVALQPGDPNYRPYKKKKMAIDTSYEGFSIYGQLLCLVVKRRETGAAGSKGKATMTGGRTMVEDWISSTQLPRGEDNAW